APLEISAAACRGLPALPILHAVLDSRTLSELECVAVLAWLFSQNLQRQTVDVHHVDAAMEQRYTDSGCKTARRAPQLMARGSSAWALRFGAQKARGASRLMRFSMQRSSSSGSMCLSSSCSCRSLSRIYTRFQKLLCSRGSSNFSLTLQVYRLVVFLFF